MQEKTNKDTLLYLHVPFCARKCDYCAFYNEKAYKKDIDMYIEYVKKEFLFRKNLAKNKNFRTCFFGGGTPGVLSAKNLGILCDEVKSFTQKDSFEEWTIELSPLSVKEDKLEVLMQKGVNRISMGVQSFNENTLKHLGRTHPANASIVAYEKIRKAGFTNVNIDLIFSSPNQKEEDFFKDIQIASELGVDHLSCYCFTIEDNTKIASLVKEGKLIAKTQEEEAVFFENVQKQMASYGFEQYEVSNYARNGKKSIHNFLTWKMADWIAIGPSGASQLDYKRWTNIASLKLWAKGLDENKTIEVDKMDLNNDILLADSFIFGLRTIEGVNLKKLEKDFGSIKKYENLLESLKENDLLKINGDFVHLTNKGLLIADLIAEEFI